MIIAVVGAGGKTTLGNFIGKSLANMNRRVLFTTTTKIFMPANTPVYLGAAEAIRPLGAFMTASKEVLSSGKLTGYCPDEIDAIASTGLFEDIIVEADGAARKPVKAPNETEPVYPAADLIIGVIGLDCIGLPVNDQNVHRAALFAGVTQASFDEPVTAQHILRLISHSEGLFRHAPASIPRVVFLNKCDTIDEKIQLQVDEIVCRSPYPVMITGYAVNWFEAFALRFLQGDSHAH